MIPGCRLTESDIAYLSQSIHATCLKELVLCGNNLSQTVPGPLKVLPSDVSGTLPHLNLRSCWLKEAQPRALLPASAPWCCACPRQAARACFLPSRAQEAEACAAPGPC